VDEKIRWQRVAHALSAVINHFLNEQDNPITWAGIISAEVQIDSGVPTIVIRTEDGLEGYLSIVLATPEDWHEADRLH
jgi:hypothetical protein